MAFIDYPDIVHACDLAARRCSELPLGHHHGSAWLFDQCMRVFDHPAAVSVTFQVYINLVGEGEVTIQRDGKLIMRRT